MTVIAGPHERTDIRPRDAPRIPEWLPYAVLLVGAGLRLFRLGDWSLWFDEETSSYFALNPGKPFARSAPLYFWLLGRVYDVTGVSVYAGRMISASAGIITLWLAWRCIRRFCGNEVALPALVLLVLSPGHLFWSQSIRYYTLVLAFQLASVDASLRAFERPSAWWWTLSIGWLLLALATHSTAALLLPVYLWAILWTLWRRTHQSWGAIVLGLVCFALTITAVSTFLSLHSLFGRAPTQPATHLLERFIAYAGVPAVALMLVGIVGARQSSLGFVFFFLLSLLPVLEMIVLHGMGLWSVAWYHGLIGVVGVAAMAGYGWKVIVERMPGWMSLCAGAASVGASLVVIAAYFTAAHGDRPRWSEAAAVLRQHDINATTTGIDVISDAPGVLAYYLGVPPAQTMGHPLVQLPRWNTTQQPVTRDTWFVLESRLVPEEAMSWFIDSCEPEGRFPAQMIVRNRTVRIYHCPPHPSTDPR